MSKEKIAQKPEIAIAIPMERTVPQASFWAFMRIVQQGYPLIQLPYMRTDLARNRYASALLRSSYSHVLMLDIDQIHPPDIVEKLSQRVVEDPERLIVGGLYFRRGEPYEPLAMRRNGDGYMYAIGEWSQGCFEVDVIGTGCLLISRQVFETIPGPPWFFYDYSKAKEDGWPTEDIAFCHLCAKHGIKIYVDTTIVSPHLTDTVIDERAFREFLRKHGRYEMIKAEQEGVEDILDSEIIKGVLDKYELDDIPAIANLWSKEKVQIDGDLSLTEMQAVTEIMQAIKENNEMIGAPEDG